MRINGSVIGSVVTSSVSSATGIWCLQNVELANRLNIWPVSNVTSGLILNLDAGNITSYPGSGTTWYDLSGNNNNGTLTNGPTFSSVNGGVIVFDGTNDFVDVGNKTITLNSGFTVDTWIKLNSNNRQQGFFGINSFPSYITDFYMDTDNKMRFEFGISGTVPNVFSFQAFNTISWYNVVGTVTNSLISLYINGIFENSTGISFTITQISGNISIGSYNASTLCSSANISINRLYNRALTASEILQNYNATKSRFGL
jgi:hypothetical protein